MRNTKEYLKEYYRKNAARIKQKASEHYYANRDNILSAKRRERIFSLKIDLSKYDAKLLADAIERSKQCQTQ